MTNRGRVSLFLGVLALGLSPSFVDWQESPGRRPSMVLYYAVIAALIAFGLWDGG